MNKAYQQLTHTALAQKTSGAFQIKPIVLLIQLAFSLSAIPALAQAQTCVVSNCSINGDYASGIDLSHFAGKDGTKGGANSEIRAGKSGTSIKLTTVADTSVTQALNRPAITINTKGGHGAPKTDNVRKHGGRGGNAGSVELSLQHKVNLSSAGQGILINAQGGNAAGYSMDSDRIPGGSGGTVHIKQATQSSLVANRQPMNSSLGVTREVIDINTSGGNGVQGMQEGITSLDDGSKAGNAGNVTLDLQGQLDLQSSTAGLIKIVSNGGNGGSVDHAITAKRHYAGEAGVGGSQTVILGQQGKSSQMLTQGSSVAAIDMASAGGRGGDSRKGSVGKESKATSGGKGGDLSLTLKHMDVETKGAHSSALVLRSRGGVGGGPGDGSDKTPQHLRGEGGAGGNISVTLDEFTDIQTAGVNSDGIHAYSAGGGGSRGTDGIITAGNGAQGGRGGDITIQSLAHIQTRGQESNAIYAESSGGSAGDGGSATFGHGGAGGRAGIGGNVQISSNGTLETSANDAHVILAQSIGGTRGEVTQADVKRKNNDDIYSLGGVDHTSDNDKASAAQVIINNNNYVTSKGNNASAVLAQSIGGGGGAGGSSFGFVAIGGRAGAGGNGGEVRVNNHGFMSTQGNSSAVIVAQSIGGGGGLGGRAGSVGVLLPSVSIGGAAGGGGHGGRVEVDNQNSLISSGDSSAAILAQSIGGGGGIGGNVKGVGAFQITSFALGASGGRGGDAGTVSVKNTGTATTVGANSHVLIAQSIGGGGGMGGNSSSVSGANLNSIVLGGRGGVGGKGGDIHVKNEGQLLSTGAESHAVFAQSIGGGGGAGGSAANLSVVGFPAGTSGQQVTSLISVGGKGGKGNHGGSVRLDNQGAIRTTGNDSTAVLMQSIGGGGGKGGGASASTIEIPRGDSLTLKVAVGGSGGKGNAGGNVHLDNSGSIETAGQLSSGIVLKSIGGGGGDGAVGSTNGFVYSGNGAIDKATAAKTRYELVAAVGGSGDDGGVGGKLSLKNTGQIMTYGDISPAILMQSIGGGGGQGAASHADSTKHGRGITLEIGGNGTKGSHGGKVELDNHGSISTYGRLSTALHAQSIGGGGGTGGSTGASASAAEKAMYDLNKQIVDETKKAQDIGTKYQDYVNKALEKVIAQPAKDKTEEKTGKKTESPEKKFDLKIALGGQGGHGGDGGEVTLTNQNLLSTEGDLSTVILAQSIGGGGGSGGSSSATSTDAKATQLNLSIGGFGRGGGMGGAVTVNNWHTIRSLGLSSQGIIAQSIGGGGGHGGSSEVDSAKTEQSQIGLSLGGRGGRGGDGSQVVVKNTKLIDTRGDLSTAVLAQSIGGGGGSGAAGKSNSKEAKSVAVNVSLGGTGGTGGKGGQVIVQNFDTINTVGNLSYGVVAQSIGGGGGHGGASSSTSGKSEKNQVTLALGGSGGSGGEGGRVEVKNEKFIQTAGHQSIAVLAQSIGGGGGSGGATITNGAESKEHQLSVTLGGSGGSAGRGGVVKIDSLHSIHSADAQAIVAQSIGGGGGVGGSAEATLEGQKETASKTTVGLTLGGSGGSGGNGGSIEINHRNQRLSSNALSGSVVLAQSVGGGGGSAGFSQLKQEGKTETSLAIALGGKGAAGGHGGEVKINNDGEVLATRGSTMGIVAQSIGGGGGNANFTQSTGNQAKRSMNIALGGTSGTAGEGGTVRVNQIAPQLMQTMGIGILAQSIGGGGGLASTAVGNAANGSGFTMNLVLGGSRGNEKDQGHGGQVNVLVKNAGIKTQGHYASAVVAQSIGGGGGLIDLSNRTVNQRSDVEKLQIGGIKAQGDGQVVNVNLETSLTTLGKNSHGIVAQSIGSGGGLVLADGINLPSSIRVGGKETNAHANTVNINLNTNARIQTAGDGSYGILAQSIGGGGGLAADTSNLDLTSLRKDLKVNDGGKSKSKGGDIQMKIQGHIATMGRNAQGIFAQSISEGGGLSPWGMGSQSSSSKGHAGEIKIELSHGASVNAVGLGSIGILAQTMLASDKRVQVTLDQSSIKARTGVYLIGGDKHSNLTLRNKSLIEAETALRINSNQNVHLNLESGSSIRSQYLLRSENNGETNKKETHINLHSGSFASGSIHTSDSRRKVTVNNSGFIDLGPIWDLGEQGVLNVNNGGGINVAGSSFGHTDLRGKGYMHLNKGARWVLDADFANSRYDHITAYTYVKLHDGSRMEVNPRTLVPGKVATVLTVHANDFNHNGHKLDVQKNFQVVHFGGSNLYQYERWHGPNNTLVIKPKANFTGTKYFSSLNEDQQSVARYLQNTWENEARRQEQQLAATSRMAIQEEQAESTTMAMSSRMAVQEQGTEPTSMLMRSGTSLVQETNTANVAISPSKLSAETVTTLAQEAEHVQTDRNDLYGFYAQLGEADTTREYADVLNNVASDAIFAPAGMMPMHNRQFVNKMYSCDLSNGQAVKNGNTCLWLDGRYNKSSMDRDSEDLGYSMTSRIVQVGGEYQFNPNWSAGASLGFDHLDVNAKNIAISTKGDAIVGGVFIKHTEGQRELAASLSTMYASYKTKRNINLPTDQLIANSKWKSWLHSLNLHAGYTFPLARGYIKPSLDLSLMHQRNPAYQEKDAGALNLHVAKESQWTVMVSPQVEVSQTYESGNYQIRPYASVGASWMSNKDWNSRMRLEGGSQDHWINIKSDLPNVVGNAKVGLNVMHAKGLDVNLEYSHQWGKRYRSSTGWLKVGYQF